MQSTPWRCMRFVRQRRHIQQKLHDAFQLKINIHDNLTVQIVGGWKVLCCCCGCWSGLGEAVPDGGAAFCCSAGLGAVGAAVWVWDNDDEHGSFPPLLLAIVVVSSEVPSGLRNHDATDAHWNVKKDWHCRTSYWQDVVYNNVLVWRVKMSCKLSLART